MLIRKSILIWWVAGTIPLVVATSGCATKKYVRNQIKPVSQQVATVEAQTNEKISAVSSKHDSDISQVNERISTTDMKLAQTASATQAAQGTASRAMEQADTNANGVKANSAAVADLNSRAAGAFTYQEIEKADVMFALNSSTLTKNDKLALDLVVQKAQNTPRAQVEIAGFTDPTGSKANNLALSRRRAESVQRYMALRNVPVRSIHIVGLGEEGAPTGLAAELSPTSTPTKAELNRLARRVRIRILQPGSVDGSAARSQ